MRKLVYFTIIVSLFACDQTQTKHKQESAREAKISKYDKLLSKYKAVSFDTLKVFSSEDLESNQYKFKGTQLDSADVLLFPESVSEQYLNDNGYFACYKFPIDSNRTALITRTPSTYEPSSIKLLIFDKLKDTITDIIELAETFGDAGDMSEKTSWLFRDNYSKYKSFTWLEESHANSAEDEKDTTIDRWNNFYLIDISKAKVDTISKNEKELLKRFGTLIKQQASR